MGVEDILGQWGCSEDIIKSFKGKYNYLIK